MLKYLMIRDVCYAQIVVNTSNNERPRIADSGRRAAYRRSR